MSGLDKMKARILEEADHSAQEILEEAKEKAQMILEQAEDEAKAEAQLILEKAKQEAQEYARRMEAASEMQQKQAVLASKQDLIQVVLDQAYEKVMNMDAGEYFKMLLKMVDSYVLPRDGEICFSKRDLKRMPKDFPEKIKKAAAAKGGTLKVNDQAEPIDGGFLLVYDGIEEDCTVQAMFAARREELADVANRQLFGWIGDGK